MPRVLVPVIVVVVLLVAGLGTAPLTRSAQPATPGEASPVAAAPPPEVCSPEELARGSLIEVVPWSEKEGVVTPHEAPGATPTPGGLEGAVLYVVKMTLPPDSCYRYRELNGALVLLVQEGTIVYTAHSAGLAGVTIKKGDNDGIASGDTATVALDTPTTVRANEWLTQDRHAWFTFRNGGSRDAVLSVAVYAVSPWDSDSCTGGCRKP